MQSFNPAPDVYLTRLVDMFNDASVSSTLPSLSITLNVDGTLIHGIMVNESAWLDQLKDRHLSRNAEVREYAKQLDEVLGLLERSVYADPDDIRSGDFVHLEEAMAVAGGTTTPLGLVRIRVANVSAWTLGKPES